MDVQDPILKRAHKVCAQQSHIPRKTDQRDIAPFEFGNDLEIVFFASTIFVTDEQRFDASRLGLSESFG